VNIHHQCEGLVRVVVAPRGHFDPEGFIPEPFLEGVVSRLINLASQEARSAFPLYRAATAVSVPFSVV